MNLSFKIGASNVSPGQIEDLVHWVEQHSPVGADIARAVLVHSDIELI